MLREGLFNAVENFSRGVDFGSPSFLAIDTKIFNSKLKTETPMGFA